MGPALRLIPGLILRLILDLVLPSQLVLYMYLTTSVRPSVYMRAQRKQVWGLTPAGSEV